MFAASSWTSATRARRGPGVIGSSVTGRAGVPAWCATSTVAANRAQLTSCRLSTLMAGEPDQVLVKFEPHAVIAVNARRGDVPLIAIAGRAERVVEAGLIAAESRQRSGERRQPANRVGMQIRQQAQHSSVIRGVAVIIELRLAPGATQLPGGHDVLHPGVQRPEGGECPGGTLRAEPSAIGIERGQRLQ